MFPNLCGAKTKYYEFKTGMECCSFQVEIESCGIPACLYVTIAMFETKEEGPDYNFQEDNGDESKL